MNLFLLLIAYQYYVANQPESSPSAHSTSTPPWKRFCKKTHKKHCPIYTMSNTDMPCYCSGHRGCCHNHTAITTSNPPVNQPNSPPVAQPDSPPPPQGAPADNPPPYTPVDHEQPTPLQQLSLRKRLATALRIIIQPQLPLDLESQPLLPPGSSNEAKCQGTFAPLTDPEKNTLEPSSQSADRQSEASPAPPIGGLSSRMIFDSSSTLGPVYYALPYHLSLDHLACIRRRLEPSTKPVAIPELTFIEKATSETGQWLSWYYETYFHRDTFLQRQMVECYHFKGDKSSHQFRSCPHQTLVISDLSFGKKNGFVEIQATITNEPGRCPSHTKERWSSSNGRHVHIVACTKCYSDAECVLRVNSDRVLIKYTCFRDVGPGTSLEHPKWQSLLTGSTCPDRQDAHNLWVYSRVWRVADRLNRPELYEYTHKTPSGFLDMRTDRRGL
ncbi:hypothetical protein B0I35DRAFT_439104 [Stachybotrys elegans]|uniref:Uncharacterized protein n=1 Tax=Stachybotrys elegans TaxID=80388 RepID=A0A8K0SIE0_9HYPO|nr:hypothetical protein B0I35DRAFT_439104 [Stachybotrys elegans]